MSTYESSMSTYDQLTQYVNLRIPAPGVLDAPLSFYESLGLVACTMDDMGLHPKLYTLHPTPYTLHAKLYTPNPKPQTPNPKHHSLHAKP